MTPEPPYPTEMDYHEAVARADRAEAALRELVRLERLKENRDDFPDSDSFDAMTEYHNCKPAAWAEAYAIVDGMNAK